jgi:hypothetical protein
MFGSRKITKREEKRYEQSDAHCMFGSRKITKREEKRYEWNDIRALRWLRLRLA